MTPEMAKAVGTFLRQAWPLEHEVENPGAWTHKFSTVYQLACSALVALGEAEETGWGAKPLLEPRPPEVLPFWEDVAVVVLWLARQHGLLDYRAPDKSLPERRVVTAGGVVWEFPRRSQPEPNLAAGPGSGPAFAAEPALKVLTELELVQDGRWTDAAETVLWRGMPGVLRLRFEDHARFSAAVETAVATMPRMVREVIDRLLQVSAADVEEKLSRNHPASEKPVPSRGMDQFVVPAVSRDMARRMITLERENLLDWIFFQHWRLGRGWLDHAGTARALKIFHDRLAIAMRKSVVARLYPGGFVWE
jgi:hypothetical protein